MRALWVIELDQVGRRPGLDKTSRWIAPSRLEAEMVAAAELVGQGLSIDEAAVFASRARHFAVHTRGADLRSRELALRIYRQLWTWRRGSRREADVAQYHI